MNSEVPKTLRKLFNRATVLGFQCGTFKSKHYIVSSEELANWRLVCQGDCWVLEINGLAQMKMTDLEVERFLEQRAFSHAE